MISVLMGVYNCEQTVLKAVASIMAQTVKDWELIVCDDGSTDNTVQIVKDIHDERIVFLQNSRNRGLAFTLNRCFAHSKGEYLARMDGDDVCFPDRFEKELAVLESCTCSVVSTGMYLAGSDGKIWGKRINKATVRKEDLITSNPIFHAPCMMRRDCFKAVRGYSESKRAERVEDVDLWIRLYAAGYTAVNIEEPLYVMTNDAVAVNRRKYRYRINSARVRLRGCGLLHLPMKYRILALKPLAAGLVPGVLRQKIRKKQLSGTDRVGT